MEENKIYCIDAFDGMKQIDGDSIDMIIADPPFGINHRDAEWDDVDFFDLLVRMDKEFMRILKEGSRYFMFIPVKKMFEIGNYVDDIFPFVVINVFARFNSHYGMNSSIQPLIVKPKGKPKRMHTSDSGWQSFYIHHQSANTSKSSDRNVNHPSSKPVRVIENIVRKFSNKDDIVLDPFIGSGSTAIACKKADRRYIGFDNKQEYVDLANDRLSKVTVLNNWI